jgi:cytochrome b involved in lipid metabolism
MKKILLVIILIIVAGAGYLAMDTHKGELIIEDEATTKNVSIETGSDLDITVTADSGAIVSVETVPITHTDGVSVSEFSQHNNEDDCWIVYKGKVYDVTKFLPFHPGGADVIAQFCGEVSGFEDAFHNVHGTSKVKKLETQAGTLQGDLAQ